MKRYRDLPLRVRLTLLYVALFSILLLVLTGVSYLDIRHFLIANLTSQLEAQAKPAVEQWQRTTVGPAVGVPGPTLPPHLQPSPGEESAPAGAKELARNLSTVSTMALVLDRQGNVVAASGKQANNVKPDTPCYEKAVAQGQRATCVVKVGGDRYLALAIPLRRTVTGETVGVAEIATSLRPVDRILGRQKFVLGAGFGALLLLGTILGLWLTTSALKPLNDMVDTCHRIAAGDLSQRVDLPRQKDEIGKLAAAFDDMVRQLESAFEAQEAFIASAAHELRTPLAAIQGSLEVLLRGALDDPPNAHRLTQSMYREVTRLFRLCDQLLDLSRLRSAESIHRNDVDLQAFFDEFVYQAKFLVQERQFSLVAGPAVTVSLDADALKQVLFNLIDNAVQHTAEGGEIRVGWQAGNDGVRIFVEDDGEGILPQDLPHVFEPFYRGDRSRSRRRGGTGLGLTLSKKLVEAHGGRITVVSKPGDGAKFRITLPPALLRRG